MLDVAKILPMSLFPLGYLNSESKPPPNLLFNKANRLSSFKYVMVICFLQVSSLGWWYIFYEMKKYFFFFFLLHSGSIQWYRSSSSSQKSIFPVYYWKTKVRTTQFQSTTWKWIDLLLLQCLETVSVLGWISYSVIRHSLEIEQLDLQRSEKRKISKNKTQREKSVHLIHIKRHIRRQRI